MSQTKSKLCVLHSAEGREVPCAYEECTFWESGGAVLPGTCLLQRLGVRVRHGGLAPYLLAVRERVEQARKVA